MTTDRFVPPAADRPLLEAALNVSAHIAAIAAERDTALAKAAAETVRADAETVRANSAVDRARELEEQLAAERGVTTYLQARCEQVDAEVRALRENPTMPLPKCEPEPARRRRRRSR